MTVRPLGAALPPSQEEPHTKYAEPVLTGSASTGEKQRGSRACAKHPAPPTVSETQKAAGGTAEVYSSAVSVKLSFLGAAMLGISRQAFLPAPAEDLRIFDPGDLGDLSVCNAALIEPQELFFLCLAAAAALLLTQSGYAAERAVLALALLKGDAGMPLRLA